MKTHQAAKQVKHFRGTRVGSALTVFFAGAAAASAFIALPITNQANEKRIFTEGLTIQVDRESPAFAALEDSMIMPPRDGDQQSLAGAHQDPQNFELTSGAATNEETGVAIAEEIARANSVDEENRAFQLALETMQAETLLRSAAQRDERVAATEVEKLSPAADDDNEATAKNVAFAATKKISLAELGITREQLLKSLLLPIAVPKKSSNDGVAVEVAHPERSQKLDRRTEDRVNTAVLDPEIYYQVVIGGEIEFSEGLALTSTNDRLIVYREFDGDVLESGNVKLRDGRYEIFVSDTRGALIAELQNPDGETFGRAEVSLGLVHVEKKQRRADDLNLRLVPVPRGISGQAKDTVFKSRRPMAPTATVKIFEMPNATSANSDGRFEDQSIKKGSVVYAKTEAIGALPVISLMSEGKQNNIDLFSESELLGTLRSLGLNVNANAGYVLGRVTLHGMPAEGAQVEFMTGDEGRRPIYFDRNSRPDLNLRATSSSGWYLFVNVSPGTHAVQARVGGERSDPKIFFTNARALSRVDINAGLDRSAKVQVFDGIRTDSPLSAVLHQPGGSRTDEVDRSGVGHVKYSSGGSLLILDADAGQNYQRTRVCHDRSTTSLMVPMVSKSWFASIRERAGVTNEAETGSLVGFVQTEGAYVAQFTGHIVAPNLKIIYFDLHGEIVDRGYGLPGGGFIAFNIPSGFRTVSITPQGSLDNFAATLLIDKDVTNVLTQRLAARRVERNQ